MTFSPIEHNASLRIGSVEFVSPDELKVCLDLEAPDGISANAGIPRAFPRINSYVLIATEAGYIVAQVEWIAIEKTPFPKRKGFQDYGLVDLPYPTRKLRANPLGILKQNSNNQFEFQRGVQSFPSIGEPVLIPTDQQLQAIVESGKNRRIKIGSSPIAGNAEVMIDPDRLFGRHLAVLGNTGSGKSCSVAGLIQWSLAAARPKDSEPNARFIVLDPNGEYTKVFKDKGRVFHVGSDANSLQVPLWFWNSAEWCSFTQASAKAQVPMLKRALREIRSGGGRIASDVDLELRRKISSILISLRTQIRNGDNYEGWKFGPKLEAYKKDIEAFARHFSGHTTTLGEISNAITKALSFPHQTYIKKDGCIGYNDFPVVNIEPIENVIEKFLTTIGGLVFQNDFNEDIPLSFNSVQFADHIDNLAREDSNPHFFEFLVMRIRTMLADTHMQSILGDTVDMTLEKWLKTYIGDNNPTNGCVTIIDLSLVPAEIVHIVTSVISHMVFEALQRYHKHKKTSLPTVLVMEEAHTFVKKYKEEAENQSVSAMCCQIFEKIAREGRKFGLGIVLSSQRPSELSPTVLSQCNSFLLHRISNDKDQELVSRLVPDNLRGLLRELPSLPSQNAILLGWASELPIMVRMNDLNKSERPHSDDPDFWNVWTGKDECGNTVVRDVDWEKIAADWQGRIK
ncbi:MAG: DUF87 domain-containing protein [Fibrobacter sp.]|nr:DUF87 domain-containing protein [Fibrobacter sp.]